LGSLFPDVIGDRVRPTKQEVFFFGTPPGDRRFTEEAMPVWADHGTHFMYGIPGNEWRGFKIADDTRGPDFDPTNGDRLPRPEALQAARDYLAFRFPALKGAPCSSRVSVSTRIRPTSTSLSIAIRRRRMRGWSVAVQDMGSSMARRSESWSRGWSSMGVAG